MKTNVLWVTLTGTFMKRSKNSSSPLITSSCSHGHILKLSTGWSMGTGNKSTLFWKRSKFNGMQSLRRLKVMENMLLSSWKINKSWIIKSTVEILWKSRSFNSINLNQWKWLSNNNKKNMKNYKTNSNSNNLTLTKELLPSKNWLIL